MEPFNKDVVGYEFDRPSEHIDLLKKCGISAAVVSAIERLKYLERRMQMLLIENQDSSHEDISEFKDVIETLEQLDQERLNLHHQLETETITRSSLRHKLKCFPNDIEFEIRTAVEAARQSNETEIAALQDKISSTQCETQELERESTSLISNIEINSPDYVCLQSDHQLIVAELNQELSKKASMQIKLNETRNTLKETYDKIAEYKEATQETEEEMVKDRVDTDRIKEELAIEIEATANKTGKQIRANIFKKREIEEQENEATKKQKINDEKNMQLRRLDKTNNKLKHDMLTLNKKLEKRIKENAALTLEGVNILKDSSTTTGNLTSLQHELNIKLAQIQTETTRVQHEREKLKTSQIKLSNEHDVAKALSSRDKNDAEETEKRLRSLKDDLLHQSDECIRLKQENLEMEAVLQQIQQTHNATVEIYNKQIQDSSAIVSREKKERHLLQAKRDDIVKATSDLKTNHEKRVSGARIKMTDNQKNHKMMMEKGAQLQEALRCDETAISDLQRKIKEAKLMYSATRNKLNADVSMMEETISETKTQFLEKKESVECEKPKFEALKVHYEQSMQEFKAKKKQVVDLNCKKSAMAATIEKLTFDVKKLEDPTKSLWEDLNIKNSKYCQDVEEQGKEIKQIEQKILSTNFGKHAIDQENKRFETAINSITDDLQFIKSRMDLIKKQKLKCDTQVKECQSWLDVKWQEDLNLDKEYYERDVGLLDVLGSITLSGQERQRRVEEIHTDYTGKLKKLFQFIDGAENQR